MRPLSDSQVQITLLGCIFFCGPALFNAIGGLGAFGLAAKDAPVANIASTALSAVFALSSLASGGFYNYLGHRWMIFFGSLTYILYVSSFFIYTKILSVSFVIVAAMLLGLGAGWLWCAQGAIMMGYPLEGEKGKYFGIFWSIYNTGGVVGNLIPLAIQWDDVSSTSISDWTFIIFLVVMSFGSLLAFLLIPTEKVVRSDGTKPQKIKLRSAVGQEFKEIIGLFKDWRMLFLFPMFFTSNWFYTYQFSLNALNMASIRTRSFNSAYYWGSQILASLIFGNFMDRPQWKRPTRARYGLLVLIIILTATWTGAIAYQSKIGPRYSMLTPDGTSYTLTPSDFQSLDFITDTEDWVKFFVLFIMFGISDSVFQAFAYWLMGALTNDVNKAAKFSGFYKFAQNIGGLFAGPVSNSVLGNTPTHPENAIWHGMGEVLICVGLATVSAICVMPVVLLAIKDTTVDESVQDSKDQKEDVVEMEVKV